MAETFICKEELVHFTNSGCNELYVTWKKCSSLLGYDGLANLLENRIQLGLGCSADGIDEIFLSEEFSSHDVKCNWLEVMEFLIDDIESIGNVSLEMNIHWDLKLRNNWVEKLRILSSTLCEQIKV